MQHHAMLFKTSRVNVKMLANVVLLLDEFNSTLDLFINEYDYAFTEIEVLTYLDYKKDFKKLLWSNCQPEEGNVITMNYALDKKIFTEISAIEYETHNIVVIFGLSLIGSKK